MKVFTAAQMREFDRVASEEYGIPSIVLMENAALRVVEFLEAKFAPLQGKKIVVLCGKGNNGGDGLAIARLLDRGIEKFNLTVVMEPQEAYKGDAAINRQIWENIDQNESLDLPYYHSRLWTDEMDEAPETALINAVGRADIIVDALFGTGFRGELPKKYRHLLTVAEAAGVPCVHVDIASGLPSETGEWRQEMRPHVMFGLFSADALPPNTEPPSKTPDFTVSFAAPKRGFFLNDGMEKSGEVWIADIGTAPVQMEQVDTGAETLDLEWAKSNVPRRPIDAHKGDAGRVLIIGGSFGMSGAVALAAKASLKSGTGLCIAAIPEKILPIFASSILEATSHPLPCSEKGFLLEEAADELAELWKNVNVVALGPGIGRTPETQKFVARVVRECPKPLVIDADALHALPQIADEVKNREAETILTPHPGEMGALMDISAKEVNEKRFETAEVCANKYGAIVVLKGARSLVATPEGQTFVNLTGNAGMATGGSGDVLTGTIAGLLAQIKDAEEATKLGVYIHGYAGDMAFRTLGNGLTAVDILEHLPLATVEIKTREPERINGRLRKLE